MHSFCCLLRPSNNKFLCEMYCISAVFWEWLYCNITRHLPYPASSIALPVRMRQQAISRQHKSTVSSPPPAFSISSSLTLSIFLSLPAYRQLHRYTMNELDQWTSQGQGRFFSSGVWGCNLDMLGKSCVSNEINSIHFDSRFRSENKLQSERVTEWGFGYGFQTVLVRWPMQLFLLFSIPGRWMAGP